MCNTTFCLSLNWSRLRCFGLLDDNLAISNLYIPEGGSVGINGSKKISAALFLDLLLMASLFQLYGRREMDNSKQ